MKWVFEKATARAAEFGIAGVTYQLTQARHAAGCLPGVCGGAGAGMPRPACPALLRSC